MSNDVNEILRLRAEVEAIKKEKAESDKQLARENLIKESRCYAEEKKYSTEMIDYFVGEDIDTSKANLDKMNIVISNIVQKALESELRRDSSYSNEQMKSEIDSILKI